MIALISNMIKNAKADHVKDTGCPTFEDQSTYRLTDQLEPDLECPVCQVILLLEFFNYEHGDTFKDRLTEAASEAGIKMRWLTSIAGGKDTDDLP